LGLKGYVVVVVVVVGIRMKEVVADCQKRGVFAVGRKDIIDPAVLILLSTTTVRILVIWRRIVHTRKAKA